MVRVAGCKTVLAKGFPHLRGDGPEESSSLIYSKRATEIKADAETERLLNDDRE